MKYTLVWIPSKAPSLDYGGTRVRRTNPRRFPHQPRSECTVCAGGA